MWCGTDYSTEIVSQGFKMIKSCRLICMLNTTFASHVFLSTF